MATRNKLIQGITIEIDGDVTKLNEALSKVNSTLKTNQSSLNDVNKLLQLNPGNAELLQQKYNILGDSIEKTKSKLETLRTASEQAAGKLSAGDMTQVEFDALQREIVDTEQKLKGLEQEFKNFGSVGAQQVAAVGDKVKEIGGKITGVGEAIMPVSAAVTGLGVAAAAKFADFDKTMNLVNSTMGNTEEEAKSLQKAIEEAAAQSVFGMSDAANAALNYARSGLNAEEAAYALAPAMNLAAGEAGDLDTVSAGLVATINGFHDTFDKAGYYADIFAAACNNSALDIDGLSRSLSIAAPVFSAAGYSIRDAALYEGIMADNGIEANKAATSLKTGLARLVKPAKEGSIMLSELGISVTNADGSMKDAITIQRELHDAFADLSESEQIAAASAIFGKNQMAPWLALINTAPDDVDKLNSALIDCAGTTDEMAESMMEGFGGSLEHLKSSIDVLVTTLGGTLAEAIQPVIDGIQRFVNWLNSLDEGSRKTIVTIGLIVAAAGPLLIIIGQITTGIGSIMTLAPKVTAGINMLRSSFGLMSGTTAGMPGIFNSVSLALTTMANGMLHPIQTIRSLAAAMTPLQAAALAAADAALVIYDVQKLTEAASVYNEAMQTHNAETEAALNNYANLYATKGKEVADQWALLAYDIDTTNMSMDQAQAALTQKIDSYWDGVPQSMWDGFRAGWDYYFGSGEGGGVIGLVRDTFFGLINSVKGLLGISSPSTVFFGIGSNIIAGLLNALASGWAQIPAFLSNAFNNLIGTAAQWGSHLVQGIANGISSAIGTVSNAASSVANAIRSFLHFSVPDVGPLTDYESWMPDMMRGLARGIEDNKSIVSNALSGMSGDMAASMQVNGQQALQGNAGIQQGIAAMTVLMAQYLPYLPQIANMQVAIDGNAIVGTLIPAIDNQLGAIAHNIMREAFA